MWIAQQGHFTYFFANRQSPHRPLRNYLTLVRKLLPLNRLSMDLIQGPQSCKPKMKRGLHPTCYTTLQGVNHFQGIPQNNCPKRVFPNYCECNNPRHTGCKGSRQTWPIERATGLTPGLPRHANPPNPAPRQIFVSLKIASE